MGLLLHYTYTLFSSRCKVRTLMYQVFCSVGVLLPLLTALSCNLLPITQAPKEGLEEHPGLQVSRPYIPR